MEGMNDYFFTMTFANSVVCPLKTIPWNNHRGAVSFTFDDGRESQLNNLAPMLDSMPEVKVTFFLSGITPQQRSRQIEGFVELIRNGHEVGNHTFDHPYLTEIADPAELRRQILNYAENLETLFKNVNCRISTFATPYCANNASVQECIGRRHFINRDCGWGGCYRWGEEPAWQSIMSKAWNRKETAVEDMNRIIDSAVDPKDGGWAILLNHGIEEDSDEYNIDPKDMKAILEHARNGEIWAAPFGTVGAYYRAHFVMDATPAEKVDEGFRMEWELPHPYMPASIPLMVKIDGCWLAQAFGSPEKVAVVQGNEIIYPDSNGFYTIEFAKRSLKIYLY